MPWPGPNATGGCWARRGLLHPRIIGDAPLIGTLLGLFYSPIGLVDLLLLGLCVWHAIRNGNVWPWIYVLVLLPGLGVLIYFVMEIVPDLGRSRGAQKLKRGAARAIDPNKDYRAAMREVEMVGSVDAKRALAEQLMERGQYADAVELYHSALVGQFATDPALLIGIARAQLLDGDGAGAQASLDALQAADPKFVSESAHMIYARALELQGKDEDALEEYRRLVSYSAGEEARTRQAMLLDKLGRRDEARGVYAQVLKHLNGAPSHYRKQQREWGDIAAKALKG